MKVAVVTGGRSGIGKGICKKLAEDGYRVYVPGRTPFEREGVTFLKADVSKEEDAFHAVEEVMKREGKIDLLVNCAGYGLLSATEFTPLPEAKAQFDTLFFGSVNMCKAVLPHMRKEGKGTVINVSSMAAAAPLPFQNYYSAAKAALNAYTASLQNEVRPYGIRCAAVLPGDTRTEFTAKRKAVLSGDGTYHGRIGKSLAKQADYESHGGESDRIGSRIAGICEKKHPKGIYTVDAVSKAEYFLIKILPHDLSAFIIGKMYGEWQEERKHHDKNQ